MPPSSFVTAATPSYSVASPATTLTFAAPAVARAGDALVIVVTGATQPVDATALPAGWSLVGRVTTTTTKVDVIRRIVGLSEPTSYVITCTAVAAFPAVLVVYRGLDPLAAAGPTTAADISASTSFTAPALSLATFSDAVITVAIATSSTSFSQGSFNTKRFDTQNTIAAASYTISVGDAHPEVVGAVVSGARTLMSTSAPSGVAMAIVLAATAAPSARPFPVTAQGALGLPSIGV